MSIVGIAVIVGFLGFIFLKHWLIAKAVKNGQKNNYAGWTREARTQKVRHETGVGTRPIRVMRPLKQLPIGLITLFFFGAMAWILGFVATPEPGQELKHWGSAILGLGFACVGAFLILSSFTRIRFDDASIARRGLIGRRVTARLADLDSVEPNGKTLLEGVRLRFRDGQNLRVKANMSGYAQLLETLASGNPQLAMTLRAIAVQGRSAI